MASMSSSPNDASQDQAAPQAAHAPSRREQERTLKRHQNKDRMVWIPRRCEVEGCEARPPLQKCARCNMVLYCSSAHQTEDWARHKKECKHLAKLGLWGCTYDEAKESAKYSAEGTLLPELRPNPPECGICGRTEPLSLTPCCQNLICNRQHEYELFSYSREFCDRSHDRYTSCGFHHGAGHAGDWRTCEQCAANFDDDYWYSNNGYNFTPGPAPPKGSFHTAECDVCKGRVHRGFEGYSTYTGQVSCNDCTSAQGRYA